MLENYYLKNNNNALSVKLLLKKIITPCQSNCQWYSFLFCFSNGLNTFLYIFSPDNNVAFPFNQKVLNVSSLSRYNKQTGRRMDGH